MEKAKSMEKVLCIGHAAYDITLPLETFPKENSKVRIGDKVECGGGAASNCATLLARWGMNTYFVGAVGNDYYGQIVRDEFQKDNIKMDYLTVTDDFKTTSSYILANTSNGSRTIVISRTKQEEAKVESLPDDATVIIADGEEPTLTEEAIRKNPNAISILDAGNVKSAIVRLCPIVQYLICSKDFAEEYTKEAIDVLNRQTLIRAYDKLAVEFHNTIIITLGEYGCFTKVDNEYMLVPSIPVRPKDSTAAGDIFHGAFAYFISHNYKLCDTMILANITGALSTQKIGGKYSIPTLEEVYAQSELNGK